MNVAQQFLIDQCIQEFNAYVQSISDNPVRKSSMRNHNWVHDEMMSYMHQRSQPSDSHASVIDVLEIYCSAESQLTNQCIRQGLRTIRFGLAQGDLSTYDGRCKLYEILRKYRPLHVWMSPKCKAWCRWNQFNQTRSQELAQKIQQAREDDEVMLCSAGSSPQETSAIFILSSRWDRTCCIKIPYKPSWIIPL